MISKQELERLIYSMDRFQTINKGDVPAIAEACKVLVKYWPLNDSNVIQTISKDQIVINKDIVLGIIETLKALL